jgi:hypothetical protein
VRKQNAPHFAAPAATGFQIETVSEERFLAPKKTAAQNGVLAL